MYLVAQASVWDIHDAYAALSRTAAEGAEDRPSASVPPPVAAGELLAAVSWQTARALTAAWPSL